jgi:hypothetical protein
MLLLHTLDKHCSAYSDQNLLFRLPPFSVVHTHASRQASLAVVYNQLPEGNKKSRKGSTPYDRSTAWERCMKKSNKKPRYRTNVVFLTHPSVRLSLLQSTFPTERKIEWKSVVCLYWSAVCPRLPTPARSGGYL